MQPLVILVGGAVGIGFGAVGANEGLVACVDASVDSEGGLLGETGPTVLASVGPFLGNEAGSPGTRPGRSLQSLRHNLDLNVQIFWPILGHYA